MGDYISRDMAIARLTKVEVTNMLATMTDAKREIAEMPAADVVPVVLCKDCKYYKPDEYECGCDFAGGLPYVKENDFCSYGERKEKSNDTD